jgi:peptide/nickel transport system substrate-binding protein
MGEEFMETYRKNKLIGIIFLVFVLLLSACSGNTSTTEQSGTETGNNGTEDSTPKQGGKVTIPIVGDPIFNPWHPNAYAESNLVNRVIFSGLTKPGEDSAPAPHLAESWEASEDGLTWTFKLRNDVKWHDGEPFTAEDVAFTFNEIVLNPDLGANGSSNFKTVESVEVVDDFTVNFKMKTANAALPAYLGFNAEIIPQHKFEGEDPWELTSFNKEAPIGTGPFKVGKYISGQSVELVRNDDYYAGVPNLDSVVFKIVPDANTQVAQALSGELDLFVVDDKATIERLEASDRLRVEANDTTRYFWISLNQENELFTDVKVRQAFVHAIDRQAIIDTVLKGYAKIADAAITPNQAFYYTDDVTRYDYNPEKAKQLLAKAGWTDSDGDGILDKDGKKFSFLFEVAQQGDLETVGQMVHQYLKDVGLEVEFQTLEWNTMIQKNVIKRDYEMILNWWSYPTDPDVFAQYYSGNAGTGNNIPGYKDEKLDELLLKGQQTANPEERKAIYTEVQQYMSDTLPYLYLWYPQEISVTSTKIKGAPEMYMGGKLYYINEWWVE